VKKFKSNYYSLALFYGTAFCADFDQRFSLLYIAKKTAMTVLSVYSLVFNLNWLNDFGEICYEGSAIGVQPNIFHLSNFNAGL
jgi:hypothetical protein